MTDYTIAETYTLPSLGKVYTQEVNPQVKIRSMTTEEEMKRLTSSDRPYQVLCEIIDDCLLEKPGISSYDMCLADYQFLLHKLRVVTYGEEYNISTVCPYCSCNNEDIIDLDQLSIKEYSEEFDKTLEFDLPKTGKHIRLKLQTPRIIDDINSRAKESRKKSSEKSGDSLYLYNLMSLIDTVDGNKLDVVQLQKFLTKLPMMDTNYILRKAEKSVERMGIQTALQLTCPICGLDYTAPFRITPEFYGPSIDD